MRCRNEHVRWATTSSTCNTRASRWSQTCYFNQLANKLCDTQAVHRQFYWAERLFWGTTMNNKEESELLESGRKLWTWRDTERKKTLRNDASGLSCWMELLLGNFYCGSATLQRQWTLFDVSIKIRPNQKASLQRSCFQQIALTLPKKPEFALRSSLRISWGREDETISTCFGDLFENKSLTFKLGPVA